MFERFTPEARRVLVLAQEEARLLNHSLVGTEHLLLGILRTDSSVARRLGSVGISLESARTRLPETLSPTVAPTTGDLPFTPDAENVLELAWSEAHPMGQAGAGIEQILLALVGENDNTAAQMLVDLGVNLNCLRADVTELIADQSRQAVGENPDLLVPSRRGFSAPWWNPLALAQEMLWCRGADRKIKDLPFRDARELKKARKSVGLSLETVAEASGIHIERVRGAESARPPVELTGNEWLRLAVALDGQTYDEFRRAHSARDAVGVYARGHMLEGARTLMKELSSENPNGEGT